MKVTKIFLFAVILWITAFSFKAHAQIGPMPCGGNSDLSTFRAEVPYAVGQIVISYGVSYQSLVNNNLGNDPCTSPSAWTTNIGTSTTNSLPSNGEITSTMQAQQQLLDPTINQKIYVDGFPASGYSCAGTWNSTTPYSRFQTVVYGGADWIAVNGSTNVTPAQSASGASQFWMQFDTTGSCAVPTQADAAFAWAWEQVQVNSTGFASYASVDLIFGSLTGGYNKNGDWIFPTNSFGSSLSIHGAGRGQTWINQTTSTKNYMFSQPTVSSAAGSTVEGLTLNANMLAGGCVSWHTRRSEIDDINCWEVQQQAGGTITAAMQLGSSGDAYELKVSHILVRTPTYNGTVAAYGTATISGGAISALTFTSGGTNLNLPVTAGPGLVTYFIGKGAGGTPCTVMPGQPTYTITSGAITGYTLNGGGSGCSGTVYVRVQQAGTIDYAYSFGASDSTYDDIVTSGDFIDACELATHGFSTFNHEHPYCAAPYQIQASGAGGSDIHVGAELDSPIQYGVYLSGAGEIWKSYLEEYNAGHNYGAGAFLIDAAATNFVIESSGCYSGSVQSFGGYAKFTGTTAGALSAANASIVLSPTGVISGTHPNCDGSGTQWGAYSANDPSNVASDSNFILVDDFATGGTTNNLVGSLGWGVGQIVGTTASFALSNSSSITHPGVFSITTPAIATQGAELNLGQYTMIPASATNWNTEWITTVNSYSGMTFRMGFVSAYATTAGDVANGFYFRYDTTIPDTTIQACVVSSSTPSCASTGVTPVGNTWHDYWIYSSTVGTIKFQVDTGTVVSACASGCTISVALPTSQMWPSSWISAQTTTAYTQYFDYYKYVQTGLTR